MSLTEKMGHVGTCYCRNPIENFLPHESVRLMSRSVVMRGQAQIKKVEESRNMFSHNGHVHVWGIREEGETYMTLCM